MIYKQKGVRKQRKGSSKNQTNPKNCLDIFILTKIQETHIVKKIIRMNTSNTYREMVDKTM